MPRNLVLTLIAVHALALVALVVAVGCTHGKRRPCRAVFERVQVGMTQEEVEATVGVPPGNYTPPGVEVFRERDNTFGLSGTEIWFTDHADLWVVFDADGRAKSVQVHNALRLDELFDPDPTRWQRLWSWVTTGQDDMQFWPRQWYSFKSYDLGVLRNILSL